MNKPFIEPPLRGYGIIGKVTLGDEVLKVLRLDGARSIEDAAIRSMLDEPSREVWTMMAYVHVGKRPTCSHVAQTVSRPRPWKLLRRSCLARMKRQIHPTKG